MEAAAAGEGEAGDTEGISDRLKAFGCVGSSENGDGDQATMVCCPVV